MGLIQVDHALVIYAVGMLLAGYGSGLFLAYWAYVGRASFVYVCVSGVLVGELLENIASFISRYEFVHYGTVSCISKWWWPFRNYVSVLAVLLLVVAMTVKWIRSYRNPSYIFTPSYEGPDRRRNASGK